MVSCETTVVKKPAGWRAWLTLIDYRRVGVIKLVPENKIYPPIAVKDGEELLIWGVVTYNLHKLY